MSSMIIDPSTGKVFETDKEGRPRRPLIEDVPEPRLEIVTAVDSNALRIRELEQSGILGW